MIRIARCENFDCAVATRELVQTIARLEGMLRFMDDCFNAVASMRKRDAPTHDDLVAHYVRHTRRDWRCFALEGGGLLVTDARGVSRRVRLDATRPNVVWVDGAPAIVPYRGETPAGDAARVVDALAGGEASGAR